MILGQQIKGKQLLIFIVVALALGLLLGYLRSRILYQPSQVSDDSGTQQLYFPAQNNSPKPLFPK